MKDFFDEETYERIVARVPYPVNPERVAKAEEVVRRCIAELPAEDVAGILGECGMWECVTWVDEFDNQVTLNLSDLQMVAAAAALASGLDGLQNEPIAIEVVG